MIAGDPCSNLQVMRSAAGWYIGRTYFDLDCGCEFPYSRESGYYATEEEAQVALGSGFEVRNCVENNAMYDDNPDIDPRPDDFDTGPADGDFVVYEL